MRKIHFGQQGTTIAGQFDWSPAIWDSPGFDIDLLLQEPSLGIYYEDRFTDLPLAPTLTTQIAFGKYKAFANTGCTIQGVSAINSVESMGSKMQFSIDTDNDQVAIAQAYPSFSLSGLQTTSGKLAFEVAYTQNSIVTNLAAGFFGLAETELWTLANGVPFNAGDAITNSASAIGFRIAEDGLGVVDTVYSDRATSFTNVGATEAGTITASTFRKYGMLYDPTNNLRCVRFFIDNIECATALTRAALIALTNLDANALGFIWANCADSAGTTFLSSMRGVRIAQYYPGMTP